MHEVLSSQRVAAGLTSEAGAETVLGKEACKPALENLSRKEKRKELKKLKRRRYRQQAAQLQKAAEDVRLDDPLEQARIQLLEQQEAEALIKGEAEHERQERLWLEREEQVRQGVDQRREEELARKQEEARKNLAEEEEPGDGWEHVEDGPAEIIWQGNEIIVKKSKKKVRKAVGGAFEANQDAELPLSNPLQPQITTFSAQQRLLPATAGHDSAVQNRNFGTEQDKTNCPFHIKTGVCRFGVSCSRAHVYPEKSCTLLVRNMYNGPGLAWEHEDGLEHTEEEVYEHFEMFYDDVHEEFQKFGELVNFKVCRNGSSHLRGNVYAHYRREEDAVSAYVALNGRYYASKQISCEFVGVTRWRVAICGEYMKANYKPCSRGTVCNFLHCFRNPRGEYSWADWDLPAPRSWQLEMNQLFGYQTIHGADSRDGGYYRRPETEDRRHQFRAKQQYHSRRYKSSDSSSDDERAEKSRAKRKPSPPHTHNWGMDTVQHGTSGHHCTSEYKGADEHQDRFGSSQHRSHRKASHWADEIGKPFNDCNSDSEESNSSHRLWKSWALKHRSSWACNDTVPSPKNRDLTRASTGFKDGKQPDCSLSRHEDIRLKRADGHLNTGSAAEGKGRTSGYSDSGSEALKSKCVNYNSNYNKPFILGGRLRNGHRCDRQGPHVSIKRERQQASYFDDKKWHSHRHKQGRRTQSSSSGPISDENYSEAGDQKRIVASAAHSGANSDDSESSNISPPTGNTTSGLRQSSTTGKYSSSVKRFHRHQEKVSDRNRKPRVGHSVKGTHSISSWFEMSSKDSHDLNDRWGG